MLTRAISITAMLALCIVTAYEIANPPTPRLLYNKSASAPIGWYVLNPDGEVTRDVIVAAFAPAEARKLAADRRYLPENIPLIKTVWAIGGERICSTNGVITTPNRPDIHAVAQDSLGRRMPQIEGCFTLTKNQVFLISTDVQTSWDSRYFGPVELHDVLGTVRYLGSHSESFGVAGGWARALGVDGKIKDNSAPWALSSCLHIFFRGAPFIMRSAPFLAGLPVAPGVYGSAPYPESPGLSRKPSL